MSNKIAKLVKATNVAPFAPLNVYCQTFADVPSRYRVSALRSAQRSDQEKGAQPKPCPLIYL